MSNITSAIEFLKFFKPSGPWVLTSISSGGRLVTKSFVPDDEPELDQWLGMRAKSNLYFQVNSTGDVPISKKSAKRDIEAVEFLHVDIDPDKKKPILEERTRILALIEGHNPRPSFVIDSGGGYQAFWRLSEPVMANGSWKPWEDKHTKPLEQALAGSTQAYNVDRIMRLPFTTNFPTKAKLKAGRVEAPTTLVWAEDTTVDDLNWIPVATPLVKRKVRRGMIFDELSDKLKAVAVENMDPNGDPYTNRSRGVWHFVKEALRERAPATLIIDILTDPFYKISEHVLEQANPRAYAQKQINNAKAPEPESLDGTEIGLANANLDAALPVFDGVLFRRGETVVRIGVPKDLKDDDIERDGGGVAVMAKDRWAFLRAADELLWLGRNKRDKLVPRDPPRILGGDIIHDPAKFPELRSIVQIPLMRWDGSLINEPGFSDGIYSQISGDWPEVPQEPTIIEAMDAYETMMEPFSLMPYVFEVDESVAASLLMCAVQRPMMETCPAHAIDANAAGSGKTKHSAVAGVLVLGHPPAHCSLGADEEETEKRLGSMLRVGDPILSIDNCTRPLDGEFLNMILTSSVAKVRPLGSSLVEELPTRSLMVFTGNNIRVKGDFARRVATVRIDHNHPSPMDLEFPFEPITLAKAKRKEIITAIHTIIRAYILAGCPEEPKPLGSFDDWTIIRGALMWLGKPDPAESIRRNVKTDETVEALRILAENWEDGWNSTIAAEYIYAREDGDNSRRLNLQEAFDKLIGPREYLTGRAIYAVLEKFHHRIIDGKRLVYLQPRKMAKTWHWESIPDNHRKDLFEVSSEMDVAGMRCILVDGTWHFEPEMDVEYLRSLPKWGELSEPAELGST